MKKIVKSLIKALESKIIYYAENGNLNVCLAAYNTHCNEELGGANYIFDLNNQKDLLGIVGKGMTAEMIAKVMQNNYHFVIFYNNGFLPLGDNDVIGNIKANAYEIAESVILYPYVDEYKEIYNRLIVKQCEEY